MTTSALSQRGPAWLTRVALCLGLAAGPAMGAERMEGTTGFAEALEAAGWSAEAQADGSLILSPAERTTSTSAAADEGPDATAADGVLQSADTPTADQGDSDSAGAQVAPSDSGDWSILSGLGWRVETDADGATLLYPPGTAPATNANPAAPEPTPEPAGSEATAPTMSPPEARQEVAQDLDALLAERGWRTERNENGSLLLFPLARDKGPTTAVAPAGGTIPVAARDGTVSLPVDSWEEARTVALSWLEPVGDPTLRLGRIRQVFRVYLISIVDAAPPHRLRHQISVSAEDGRVIVLN